MLRPSRRLIGTTTWNNLQHHHVKFLPGVNINSNPLCGQHVDGTPMDCGESEWWV